ncbi:MAG: 16S rRNA (cytosine(967)-C(5))-methyltransferase RsmB [Deltaproteobacteria bacterium]
MPPPPRARASSPPGSPPSSPPSSKEPTLARRLALEVLVRVERDEAFANAALAAALEGRPDLSPRDAALANELVFGTLRRQLRLDHALSAMAGRPMAELELPIRVALRLGALQLLFLRVPARAAVDESVELVKSRGLARAGGLVNAVLRRLSREGEPPLPDEPIERLAVEESHPRWLVQRWVERLGLERARARCAANNRPAPLCLRVSPRIEPTELARRLALARPDATIERGQFAPRALELSGAGSPAQLPGQAEGHFQIQDQAAQLVALYAAPGPGPFLDVCAAPGGKACQLAELGAAPVFALDISPRKLARVVDEARRLGPLEVLPLAADARLPLPFPPGSQQQLLVDAPCSGLGTLRRHPEVRYRRSPDDPPRMAALQREILARAVDCLAQGGTLSYAVCSTEPEEGAEQLAWLQAERPELSHAPPPPGWALPAALPFAERGPLETSPEGMDADGFYAFRLRRG